MDCQITQQGIFYPIIVKQPWNNYESIHYYFFNFCSRTEEDWEVSSFVMSCYLKLDNTPVYDLSPPATLSFKTSVGSLEIYAFRGRSFRNHEKESGMVIFQKLLQRKIFPKISCKQLTQYPTSFPHAIKLAPSPPARTY